MEKTGPVENPGDIEMFDLCDQRTRNHHVQSHRKFSSRRRFLKHAAATTGLAASGVALLAPRPAAADDPPSGSGNAGHRYIIRGGSVMSMDPQVGDFPQADVLIEGKKILAVGQKLAFG